MEKITPIIVVSRCLGFEPCRYDGQMYKEPFVEELKGFVKILTICPEMEIGMGVPRDTIRIVNLEDGVRLIQIATGQDFHKDMNLYIEKMFNSLNDIDGFILKSKSPSCGIQDVKIYHGMQKSAHSTKGSGLVGGAIRDRFTNLAVEDEGRLKNYRIREHFLTKIYAIAEFRIINKGKSFEELKAFHIKNRLLFMSYNNRVLNEMEKILVNKDARAVDEVFQSYSINLSLLFIRTPRNISKINVLVYIIKEHLNEIVKEEERFIMDTIEKFKNETIPYSVPLYLIKNCAVRLKKDNLLRQSFFNPYPEELIKLMDSGKGRV